MTYHNMTGIGPEITETELRRAGEAVLITYLTERLERAGVITQPSLASQWLRTRVDSPTRRAVLAYLFPTLCACEAVA